jgi:hypothetical protein
MTTAIENDAAEGTTNEQQDWSEDRAAEEMLRRFKGPDAKEPSGEKDSEAKPERAPKPAADDEDSAEEPETDAADDEGEEGDDETTEQERKYADDGAYIKIKVGDEEQEFSVKSLARLAGQEAALTKKSMEVAETRKTVEATQHRNTAATAALLERARQRFEPYANLDFNLLASQLPAEDYTALRQSAQAAYEDVQFLEGNLDGFMQAIQAQQRTDHQVRATECLKTLQGPTDKGGIEGFSPKLYDEIRSYAVSIGAPADRVDNLVDPWAIRMIHDAMLYARGKDKAAVKTVKINKTPKKIVKTTSSPTSQKGGGGQAKAKQAMARLAQSGSTDDAAEALLARWGARTSDD